MGGVLASQEDKQRAGQASPKKDNQRAGQASSKEDNQRAGQAGAVRRALNYARETLASHSMKPFITCGREPMRWNPPVLLWIKKSKLCCNRLQAHHPMSLRDQRWAHPLLRL